MNTDELRKLAEAAIDAYTRINLDDEHFDVGSQADIDAVNAFDAAASPAAVLALLDEIDRLKHDIDRHIQIVSSEAQMVVDAEEERDEARAAVKRLGTVLNIIAGYSPEVTHGWADDVREMATAALDDPVVKRIVEE